MTKYIKTHINYLVFCPVCGSDLRNLKKDELLDIKNHSDRYEKSIFVCPICDVDISFELWK